MIGYRFVDDHRADYTIVDLCRVAGVGLKLLNIAKSLAFDSALGSGAWACAPQVAMGTLMAGVLVIFMMYGMGIWLGKLREARSWQGI